MIIYESDAYDHNRTTADSHGSVETRKHDQRVVEHMSV